MAEPALAAKSPCANLPNNGLFLCIRKNGLAKANLLNRHANALLRTVALRPNALFRFDQNCALHDWLGRFI